MTIFVLAEFRRQTFERRCPRRTHTGSSVNCNEISFVVFSTLKVFLHRVGKLNDSMDMELSAVWRRYVGAFKILIVINFQA